MKSLLLIILVSFYSYCFSQKINEKDVPNAVQTAFHSKFKEVKKVHWMHDSDGTYEAEFKMNKNEMSATYKPDGTLLETETEIKISDLPYFIFNYIAKNYPGYKVSEAAMIIDMAGVKKFEAEVKNKKDGKEMDLFFDEKGDFLSKK